MGGACSACRGGERPVQGFRGETWGKISMVKPRRKWEYNIEMDVQEVRCGVID